MLDYIRDNLGYGQCNKYDNYSRFQVTNQKDIDRLITLFNGNLVLNKTRARFLHWLSFRKVEMIERKLSWQPDNNGWLAGFIDGEGCFYCGKEKFGVSGHLLAPEIRFLLDQKGEREILLLVQSFLQGGTVRRRQERENMWRYSCTSRCSQKRLGDYLAKYPLVTPKREAAALFFTLRRLIDNKKKRLELSSAAYWVDRLGGWGGKAGAHPDELST